MKLSGVLKFPVFASRVGDGTSAGAEFLEWVETQYPSLNGLVTVRGDWLGAVQGSTGAAPNVGCVQWSQLHALADGKAACCCIDSDGVHRMGDAKCQHVIQEIHRRPLGAKLRSEIPSRLEVDVCGACPMLP